MEFSHYMPVPPRPGRVCGVAVLPRLAAISCLARSLIVYERLKMRAFQVTLQRNEPVAEDTMAFHLSKPAGLRFQPGQVCAGLLNEAGVNDHDIRSEAFY